MQISKILIPILTAVLTLVICNDLYSQTDDNLIRSRYEKLLNEIHILKFEGNKNFTDSELQKLINTEANETSIFFNLSSFYYFNIKNISAAPSQLKSSLENSIKSMMHELGFFNKIKVENDLQTLQTFYNKHGFHFAEISYTFRADTAERENILTFHINEGKPFTLKTINYIGLDSLPREVNLRIENVKLDLIGEGFNENEVMTEINQIHRVLLNTGYYYSYYETPPTVVKDPVNYQDSITVVFHTGERQKIGRIDYVDDKKGQHKVANSMKKIQMEIEEGDWYSRQKVKKSESNLRYLGTFNLVAIDTTSEFAPQNDSTLNLRVFCQYRKLKEWNTGIFVNQTIDNFVNAGVEASFVHRNIFGIAQVLNPSARGVIRDVNNTFKGWTLNEPETWQVQDLEGQLSVKFGQPIILVAGGSRVGAFTNPMISYRRLFEGLVLKTISLPFKFPVKQQSFNVLTDWSVSFLFEHQDPMNFGEFSSKPYENAMTREDSNRIRQSLLIYSTLDDHVSKFSGLTSTLMGFTAIGEHRDNIFYPSRGYYLTAAIDFPLIPRNISENLSGVSHFVRPQFALHSFKSMNDRTVLAGKARIGHIFPTIDDPFIPLEKQFFAGGANSVRGWPARELRYTSFDIDSAGSVSSYDFLQNFVGSSTIIEFSGEVRYQFPAFKSLTKSMQDFIAGFGFTGFVDVGNAFGWLAENVETKVEWYEYATKLAVSAGLGIWYKTPIGPFRVDFAYPLYDPSIIDKKFDEIQFHIGLGFSF